MVSAVYIELNQTFSEVESVRTTSRGISREQRANRIAASAERSEGIRRGRMRLAKAIDAVNEAEPRLSTLRLKAGLSQAELGQLIDMKQPNVARFEKNPGNPQLETLRKLSKALGVSMDLVADAIEATNKAVENEAVL